MVNYSRIKEVPREVKDFFLDYKAIPRKTKEFYQKPKVKFNANILLAGVAGLGAAAGGGEIADLVTESKKIITAASATAHFLTYLSIHPPLHYFSNKGTYGEKWLTNRKYWKDLGKIYLTLIPSSVIYTLGFPSLNYFFLTKGLRPALSTTISWATNVFVTRSVHTLLADRFGVFKPKDLESMLEKEPD